jgi:hypothetical protein
MGTNTITYLDRTFDAHDVISGNAYYARPLNSASLEIDTFSFDVQSDDTSLTEFIRNTPLTFYHDGNQMGIFYVQTISRTSINTYHFTCTSTVGLLDETYHDGGIYTGETVRKVCTDICSPLTCYVKSNIANIKLYGWLPIATRRENLAQVLFAIGATLKVDYNGAIRIEGLWDGQSSQITASEMYAGGSVEYATPVTEVIVTEHAYSQSPTDVTKLFNGTTAEGDKITFNSPCYDLEATGFEIKESGANYAIVTAGSGVLNGKKYAHVTRQVTRQIKPKTRSLVKQSGNAIKVEKATLVSLVNANAVAERLAEYYSHNERINNKIVIKREIPGDVVQISHPYGGEVTGCIESTDVTVSGRLAAQESVLVGYKPQNIGEQEYYDTVEVLTKDGTWTVPESVKSLRVILIGGGQGGNEGKAGENADTNSGMQSGTNGALGGEGGAGGMGGNILQKTLEVSAGQTFRVAIGAGGKGATYNPDEDSTGAAGENSTFGELTSADGSAAIAGFFDLTSGLTYGKQGDKGYSGATGGNGGKYNETGKNGGAVQTFAGGESVAPSTKSGGYKETYYEKSGSSSGGSETRNVFESDHGPIVSGHTSYSFSRANGYRDSGSYESYHWDDLKKGVTSATVYYAQSPTKMFQDSFRLVSHSGNMYTVSINTTIFSAAIKTNDTRYVKNYGGGGGGGAAFGENGIDAAEYGVGGQGANALAPVEPTVPGQGGAGGNGGGGGGGAGGFLMQTGSDASATYDDVSGGTGGAGSNGGDGAPGCVLIYYRLPKALSDSGAVHDKNGKIISDKYGRRLVV